MHKACWENLGVRMVTNELSLCLLSSLCLDTYEGDKEPSGERHCNTEASLQKQ